MSDSLAYLSEAVDKAYQYSMHEAYRAGKAAADHLHLEFEERGLPWMQEIEDCVTASHEQVFAMTLLMDKIETQIMLGFLRGIVEISIAERESHIS